ncbi:MAG: type II toxin-antitoxin system HicB family antitoxin [Planctomycetes bacterium]|nr:type II toxin-antitoxin system HicB family antitoxin [Planctomycetota bacterium]
MSDNSMKYKGYVGTVEYSAEDGCFIGRIHGISDIVSFEGESVKELEADFRNAVDSYLLTCAEIGKKPEKQCSGKMLLRMPAELHYQLTVQAEATGFSVNSLVVEAVKEVCKRHVRRPAAKTANRRKPKAQTKK